MFLSEIPRITPIYPAILNGYSNECKIETMVELNISPSQNIYNLFYSDLFVIEKQGCLLMGAGKTIMGSVASDHDSETMISQDSTCLLRERDTLYGHFEMPLSSPDWKPKRTEVHHLIRCLSDEETQGVFKNRQRELLWTDYQSFIRLCEFNITFVVDPMGLLRRVLGSRYDEYMDPLSRVERFIELTSGIPNMEYIIIPWMNTVEEKADLLRSYLSEKKSLKSDADCAPRINPS